MSGETAVVIDIGGGSVEVTRGVGPAIELGRSFKLGVIRLTERFLKEPPDGDLAPTSSLDLLEAWRQVKRYPTKPGVKRPRKKAE